MTESKQTNVHNKKELIKLPQQRTLTVVGDLVLLGSLGADLPGMVLGSSWEISGMFLGESWEGFPGASWEDPGRGREEACSWEGPSPGAENQRWRHHFSRWIHPRRSQALIPSTTPSFASELLWGWKKNQSASFSELNPSKGVPGSKSPHFYSKHCKYRRMFSKWRNVLIQVATSVSHTQ